MPERVGWKVLPISTKSRFLLLERLETVDEQQEPPCIHAGEASVTNCIILDNTLEISAALNALAREGYRPSIDELAALSP